LREVLDYGKHNLGFCNKCLLAKEIHLVTWEGCEKVPAESFSHHIQRLFLWQSIQNNQNFIHEHMNGEESMYLRWEWDQGLVINTSPGQWDLIGKDSILIGAPSFLSKPATGVFSSLDNLVYWKNRDVSMLDIWMKQIQPGLAHGEELHCSQITINPSCSHPCHLW
jgi:hypothetical protein